MFSGSSKWAVRVMAVVMCAVTFVLGPSARAATPEEIEASIKKAVDFLYSTQNEFGNWEAKQQPPAAGGSGLASQYGGETALAVYALLAAGEKPLDPRIVKATDWLRKATVTGHYALGVRANVWLNLPKTEANEDAMAKDARLLMAGVGKSGKGKGFYNYLPPTTSIDLSCSQYGVLGAWAAAQRIEEMKKEYWVMVENAWHGEQSNDGGWAYHGKDETGRATSIQLTAAGVATLFITQEFVHSDEGIEGNKGNPVDPHINKGLAYIAKAYADLVKKPDLYAFYACERVGVASGYKYFGDVDWFQAGADVLVKKQAKTGSWSSHTVTAGTAFGILFLSRGRAPVMMNKLEYNITPPKGDKGKEGNWNQRPRDAANATRWVQEKIERTLNWQIINLNVADIHDLHDSGLLYITGNETLSFTPKEKAMLKQYIEEGGIIIGNADVGKEEFKKSFRDLAREFFPEYEFKKLSEMNDHPLMNNQNFKASTWKKKPLIEAVGNDARLFMILIPNDDFSRYLQKRDYNREEIFQFFANAFLYSTDKIARFKGQTHIVRADPAIKPTTTIKVARIRYSGRWDPEPGGWKRLAAVMNNEDKTALDVKTVELGKDSLADFKIAHITGTDKFVFTEAQRKALKDFVAGGGLLVVDACGGISDFDSAMQTEIAKIFPAEAAQIATPLKLDNPIYTSEIGGKIEPKYRVYAMQRLGGEATKFRLRGLEIGGKLGIVYSSDDLSVALVGQPVDGIIGLEPNTATVLMRRILTLKSTGKI